MLKAPGFKRLKLNIMNEPLSKFAFNLNLRHYSSVNTYLSRDAGVTWEEVMKGPHIYEFGNHGGLIVVAKLASLGPTDEVYFSRDEGLCWEGPAWGVLTTCTLRTLNLLLLVLPLVHLLLHLFSSSSLSSSSSSSFFSSSSSLSSPSSSVRLYEHSP